MSVGRFLQQAAAGNAGGGVYVDDVFSTYLYEGTNANKNIVNGIDLAGEGGMVWSKARNVGYDHGVMDTERGVSGGNLQTNENFATQVAPSGKDLTSFNSDGYTIGPKYTGSYNNSGSDYVSWTFRKQPGFFDVVTYTGDGTTTKTVNHSLGSTPGMIAFKRTDSTGNWIVWHRSTPNGSYTQAYQRLNGTFAPTSLGDYGNSLVPTDSVIKTPVHSNAGNTADSVNVSGATYVAYIFAHDAQDFGTDSDEAIIKCGSYTGTGSAGNSINLGFEPQWLMIKQTSGANDWYMYDTMRGIATGGNDAVGLKANSSDAEGSSNHLSVTSTGFELEGTGGGYNGSGATYIYIAIRRPHKPASEFAATELFAVDQGAATNPAFESGFPVDWALWRNVTSSQSWYSATRLLQGKSLFTDLTQAEQAQSQHQFDHMDKFYDGTLSSSFYSWMFRRAPGFFDVVAYTGEIGASGTGHNLGVTPEFIIVKRRDGTSNWRVWHKDLGSTESLILNDTSSVITGGSYFNDPPADADKIYPGGAGDVNTTGVPYITYLFASVPGISKVGSYTGTGSDVDVDCGFTSGARFVLVKSAGTGHWVLWDTVRGIVAGNDPYVLLSSSAAQTTGTDYIDPLSSGFTITSTAPTSLNQSGTTYIFLAIA